MAGIAFVGCGLADAASAQAQTPPRSGGERPAREDRRRARALQCPRGDGPGDHILGTPGLTDDERVAMLGATAAKLLGIKS